MKLLNTVQDIFLISTECKSLIMQSSPDLIHRFLHTLLLNDYGHDVRIQCSSVIVNANYITSLANRADSYMRQGL